MFGISFTELAFVALVALVVVGPKQLPRMLATIGQWIGKARRFVSDVRAQTGIDEILREEGLHGGLHELRSIMRGDIRAVGQTVQTGASPSSPLGDTFFAEGPGDRTREYPPEGADAAGALADDLIADYSTAPAAEDPAGEGASPSESPTLDGDSNSDAS